MSENLNATCDICGNRYHVCNSCKDVKSFSPWRTITDTIEHYKIFLVLSEYTKDKDKVKAREELSKCDLSEISTFTDNVKKTINEIMEEAKAKVVSTNNKKIVKKSAVLKEDKKDENIE